MDTLMEEKVLKLSSTMLTAQEMKQAIEIKKHEIEAKHDENLKNHRSKLFEKILSQLEKINDASNWYFAKFINKDCNDFMYYCVCHIEMQIGEIIPEEIIAITKNKGYYVNKNIRNGFLVSYSNITDYVYCGEGIEKFLKNF